MCGRYALALRASQVRQMLEDDDMPVADAPDDDGAGAPRQSYNFAPGYHGIIYSAATPDWGAGPRPHAADGHGSDEQDGPPADVTYRLQSMKWGLIPFWTKRSPDYLSMMRTINCRDDSLSTPGGMWATMKARKRCIVVAQGFYEWLKTGPREKLPHYIKRADVRLICLAGLWGCVQYEGSDEKHYTYTIITTDSNKQLKFLHDRMPVVLGPGSDKMTAWLDPAHHEWTRELQSLLRPFSGALDVYPVSKDVGKVGNNSPSFIIPLDSKENKSNIANFFSNAQHHKDAAVKAEKEMEGASATVGEADRDIDTGSGEDAYRAKRKAAPSAEDGPPLKNPAVGKNISSTRNEHRSPVKSKEPGSQKISFSATVRSQRGGVPHSPGVPAACKIDFVALLLRRGVRSRFYQDAQGLVVPEKPTVTAATGYPLIPLQTDPLPSTISERVHNLPFLAWDGRNGKSGPLPQTLHLE